MMPDISGKDVTLQYEADMQEARNEDKVSALLHGWGYPELALQIAALQLRVETLVTRTVGVDPRFELEYEQKLGELLDEIILGFTEADKQ